MNIRPRRLAQSTVPNTTTWDVGVHTPTEQPPGNDSAVFFASSFYVGVSGNGAESVWVGYAGTNDPSDGAVLAVLQNATSGIFERSGTADEPASGPLHIVSASSYGHLQLADKAGDAFTLDSTDPSHPTITPTPPTPSAAGQPGNTPPSARNLRDSASWG